MQRLKMAVIAVLSGLVIAGVSSGITTPQAVQAKVALREAEIQADRLFHSPKLGTNGQSCDNCHVDGGRFSHRLGNHRIPSLVDAKDLFPQVHTTGQVNTLETEINHCIVRQLDGHPLPESSRTLALLDLYLRHLSRFHER